ncbi:hypothetical protein BXZ70DRAFT_713552 [Cristinia sonorae]|uniref:TM7S3/TM198-like domain-containing protein n=1 Tax=Cristinia sonorae TaxID=1940300 RepID=A0A8K0XSM4_9AGAR|nr:hypothetical protein BXZ70DRAFT_713552 [Cristinia sonorae]
MASSPESLRLLFSLFVLSSIVTAAASLPHSGEHVPHLLSKRHSPLATYDNGTLYVPDPDTQLAIPQGSASDGAGFGFDPPAVIWLVWSFAVGIPLALAGIRLSFATTGASTGIACTLLVWTAFANTLNATGISDVLLTGIAMGAFVLGFIMGALSIGRLAGITLLGITGGLSIGVRIVLLRPGLLIPTYGYNWIIVTIPGVVGFLLVILRQRMAITSGSASVGTFLVGLAIDLSINKQKGMSQGLRFLFDRNRSHLVDLFSTGYHPTASTYVILALTLVLTPCFAFMQEYFFKQPFRRVRSNSLESLKSRVSIRRSTNNAAPEETETLQPPPEDYPEKGDIDSQLTVHVKEKDGSMTRKSESV